MERTNDGPAAISTQRSNRMASLKSSFENASHSHANPSHSSSGTVKVPTRESVQKIASIFQTNPSLGSSQNSLPNLLHSPTNGVKSPEPNGFLQHNNNNNNHINKDHSTASIAMRDKQLLVKRDHARSPNRQSCPAGDGKENSQPAADDRRTSLPPFADGDDHVVRFQHAKDFFRRKEEASKNVTGALDLHKPRLHLTPPPKPGSPDFILTGSNATGRAARSSVMSPLGASNKSRDSRRSSSESRVHLYSPKVRPDLLPNCEPEEKSPEHSHSGDSAAVAVAGNQNGNWPLTTTAKNSSPVKSTNFERISVQEAQKQFEPHPVAVSQPEIVHRSPRRSLRSAFLEADVSNGNTSKPADLNGKLTDENLSKESPRKIQKTESQSPIENTTGKYSPSKSSADSSLLNFADVPPVPKADKRASYNSPPDNHSDYLSRTTSSTVVDDGRRTSLDSIRSIQSSSSVKSDEKTDEFYDPQAPPMPPLPADVRIMSPSAMSPFVSPERHANPVNELLRKTGIQEDDLELMTEEERQIFMRGPMPEIDEHISDLPMPERTSELDFIELTAGGSLLDEVSTDEVDDDYPEYEHNDDAQAEQEEEEELQPRQKRRTTVYPAALLAAAQADASLTIFDLHPRTRLDCGHCFVDVAIQPKDDEDWPEDKLPDLPARNVRVRFNFESVRIYSTHSRHEYDRSNDEVDPVAASAEYELEKRIEKMDVFPIELMKEPGGGLGLSIIGMGVGADAGLEKLGIFVKSVSGPAQADGRIRVNDQIIEVDGKSLVGVTQTYAAQVLRATSGLVSFLIGREKENAQSEVAGLIEQSRARDREREKQSTDGAPAEPEIPPNQLQDAAQQQEADDEEAAHEYSGAENEEEEIEEERELGDSDEEVHEFEEGFEPDTPTADLDGHGKHYARRLTATDSLSPVEFDIDNLKVRLAEAQQFNTTAELEVNRLRTKLAEFENEMHRSEEAIQMGRQNLDEAVERQKSAQKTVDSLQQELLDTQARFQMLERKYNKAKKLIRNFQQQLEQQDKKFKTVVADLTEHITSLRSELAGKGTISGVNLDSYIHSQLMARMSQDAAFSESLNDISDTDDVDASFASSTAVGVGEYNDETLSKLVPVTQLLNNAAARSRAELVQKGSLAQRQPPSHKRHSWDTDKSSSSAKSLAPPPRPSLPPPAVPARPPRVKNDNSSSKKPRQSSQTSVSSTISSVSSLQDETLQGETTKFSPLKNPGLNSSLSRAFARTSNSSKSSPSSSQNSTPEKKSSSTSVDEVSTDWTSHHVQQWLLSFGLSQHITAFATQNIDGPSLLELNREKLRSLGVVSEAEQDFIKKKIKEFKNVMEKEKKTTEKIRKKKEKIAKKSNSTSPQSPTKK